MRGYESQIGLHQHLLPSSLGTSSSIPPLHGVSSDFSVTPLDKSVELTRLVPWRDARYPTSDMVKWNVF